MSKLSPVRDDELKSADATRLVINGVIKTVNAFSGSRSRVMRVQNVQSGMQVVLTAPGFTVGAAVVAGVAPTNGGAAPTAAPWVEHLTQQQDGRVTMSIGGLGAAPALYAVNLVLFEGA